MFLPIKYLNGRWNADLVTDRPLLRQLREDADLLHKEWPEDKEATYDKLLRAAAERGIGLETSE